MAIADTLAGIRREARARPSKKKAAIAASDLVRMIAAVRGIGSKAMRDRAVLALGLASAMRRSELVALQLADVALVKKGARITIRHSQTDQEGEGQVIAIPNGPTILPVARLKARLALRGDAPDPLFTRFAAHGAMTGLPMSDRAIARIVQKYAGLVGLGPAMVGAHSLRAGFLTGAARSGASCVGCAIHFTRILNLPRLHLHFHEIEFVIGTPLHAIDDDGISGVCKNLEHGERYRLSTLALENLDDDYNPAKWIMKLTIALLLAALPAPALAQTASGVAVVIDGDSLTVGGRAVRLFGIDAPEGKQTCEREGTSWACGEEAASQLRAIVDSNAVECAGRGVDQYGRLLGVCRANGFELNGAMVEAGWATAYRSYSDDYVPQEVRAKAARLGIWSSAFVAPEEYRMSLRSEAPVPPQRRAQAAPPARHSQAFSGCVIKGNRNRRGQWIYHLPGMPYYEVTRAEELFCTEAQAQAAGYRRAIVK